MNDIKYDNPFQSPTTPSVSAGEAEPEIVAAGTLSVDDISTALHTIHSYWPSPLAWFGFAITVMMGLLGAFDSILIPCLTIGVPLIGYAAFVVISRQLAYQSPAWQSLFQRFGDAPQPLRIRMAPYYLEINSPSLSAILTWNRIIDIFNAPRELILVFEPQFLLPIPAHFFECEADFIAAGRMAYDKHMDHSRRDLELLIPKGAIPSLATANPPADAVVGLGRPTWPEFYATATQLMWPKPGTWFQIGSLLMASHLGALAFLEPKTNVLHSGAVFFLAIFGLIALFVAARKYYVIAKQFRQQSRSEQTQWIVTADQLRIATSSLALTFPWTYVSRIDARKDCLLFVFQRFYTVSLAKRYFSSDEDWRQVVAWAVEAKRQLQER
ncbi:hypothetical protein LOC68_12210 [Blastopirellula sp. JC732]|uniref:YcxB-like protein domain-containing protein n=1 Tax=Blastopirellula sediminis TaxID=2894196 RepID=A0A9X1MLD7_9BACT|nr:hypothetical protein [Blastopirellula sediminis]MCC9607544.1 hypothetical protein [Blastopirellula sediminis]MCC9629163.1 hypothetical protein [Blastopirellula sediminis]